MDGEHLPFFVYGTLQRGEERAERWPFAPQHIEWATIRGRLLDLGPYPGLVEGDDLVLGELWHLHQVHVAETLRVLDAIECFGNDDVDLYVRRIVDCQTLNGSRHRAYVYYLAEIPRGDQVRPVLANERGYCHWARNSVSGTGQGGRDVVG